MNTVSKPSRADRQWHIVSRWHEYEGEARANLLRIAAIGAFYLVEILNYHGLQLGPWEISPIVSKSFHAAVTGLALGWAVLGMVVLFCLRRRIFPAGLKYCSTAADLLFLTGVLAVGSGPRSPLVIGYFVILVLASLRFSLGLVRFAGIGAGVCYIGLLVYAKWFTEREITVPRQHELIVLVGFGLTAVMLGQVVRRAARMADEFAARVAPLEDREQ